MKKKGIDPMHRSSFRCRRFGLPVAAAAMVLAVCAASPFVAAQESTGFGGSSLLSAGMLGQDGPIDLSSFITETAFSGYIDTAYFYNFDANDTAAVAAAGNGVENGLRVFDIRQNELVLHGVSLDINKDTNADSLIGYQVTMIAGDDASVVNATSPTAGDVFAADDFSLTNAYIKLQSPDEFIPGLQLQIGHFETTIGGQGIHSVRNINFSRSYAFGFGGPYTHTGVLARYAYNDGDRDILNFHLGWVNGWDNFNDNNDSGTLLAGVELRAAEFLSFALNSTFGPEQTQAFGAKANGDYRTLLEFLVKVSAPEMITEQMEFLDGLEFILDTHWGGEEGVPGIGTGGGQGYAQWFGVYGIIKLPLFAICNDENDVWAAFRGEYFQDQDGARGIASAVGVRDDIYALTWTLGFQPTSSLLIRGEARLDKASYDAFHNGTRSHQFTVGANVVLSF